jgi:hypothetical protein
MYEAMGIAERKFAEIVKRREQDDFRLKFALRSALIADTAAPNMWQLFVTAIEEEVKACVKSIPEAKSLRADLENENNLTVRTTLVPLHTLVLIRNSVGIQGTLSPFPSDRLKRSSRPANLEPLFFSTDADLKPCFRSGQGELSLDMAVEHFLAPLFDLF